MATGFADTIEAHGDTDTRRDVMERDEIAIRALKVHAADRDVRNAGSHVFVADAQIQCHAVTDGPVVVDEE